MQKQLFRHAPDKGIFGDCYRTAVACILDLDPDQVPHVHRLITGAEQGEIIDRFLAEIGVTRLSIPFTVEGVQAALDSAALWSKGLPCLFSGTSRNGTGHVVVAHGGKIICDPSQDDSGIVGPMDDGFYWVEWLVFSAEDRGAA
ncbi:hypothetical protein EN739_24440 [Mesorhizobium sp. M2A.F.Ca.ET.017.03.2.1]|uniref:hypothetical protein n=1 Tax=unclassified Mesorhizobium TaxID=325217 RepID=UPI000FCCDF71|nr:MULTISPECIES: hypothetical protein [unclassified Mesorhizobium]RUW39153.1 hypothetical protein EOA37_21115 [Mesorhizobium sp. M2A.F.Ca.ET.015.02.1.1]RVC92714.1 hypothetical protein EN739_24440 [Mesorhizobium sp. M2A.F.Ca.ET.017.03.2.1]